MRQSIVTKYIGPGNVRGSRVSATASGGARISSRWDDALDSDANHIFAARALAVKLGWFGAWVPGSLGDGARCVFVNVDEDAFTIHKPTPKAAP